MLAIVMTQIHSLSTVRIVKSITQMSSVKIKVLWYRKY